ncbi:MAG: hypothetical protein OXI77_10295 [Chloroflexota bacterium]|nr:hypothetical protein [Chloroflexota bacterium]MDE2910912.1 hypothetical protein [Chloroflexota bacterium]
MARLSDIEGKSLEQARKGAYARCFGNAELSRLLSRVQSLIIKNGNELEKLVTDLMSDKLIHDVDEFLSAQIMDIGVRVATKKALKKCSSLKGDGIEPDFIVFDRKRHSQDCYVVELKDGHEFDTKSSEKEQQNLVDFLAANDTTLQFYNCHGKICGFNANTREEIQIGFKRKISIEEAMTGREFCELVAIDYDQIISHRSADRVANYDSFLSDLLDIPSVQSDIHRKLTD